MFKLGTKRKKMSCNECEQGIPGNMLKNRILHAIEKCREWKIFDKVENQPPLKTLVGLLLGQGQSFKTAKYKRRQVFEWLLTKKKENGNDDVDSTMILGIGNQQWQQWNVSKDIVHSIQNIAKRVQTGERMGDIVSNQHLHDCRIGPWTRKAFRIMCENHSNQLLIEDPWVRKRWFELTNCKLTEQNVTQKLLLDNTKTMVVFHLRKYTSIHIDAIFKLIYEYYNVWTMTLISRFLWRLTSEGVKQLLLLSNDITREAFL